MIKMSNNTLIFNAKLTVLHMKQKPTSNAPSDMMRKEGNVLGARHKSSPVDQMIIIVVGGEQGRHRLGGSCRDDRCSIGDDYLVR